MAGKAAGKATEKAAQEFAAASALALAQQEMTRGCVRCCGIVTMGGNGLECSVVSHPDIPAPPRACAIPGLYGRLSSGKLSPETVDSDFVEKNRAPQNLDGTWAATGGTPPDKKEL